MVTTHVSSEGPSPHNDFLLAVNPVTKYIVRNISRNPITRIISCISLHIMFAIKCWNRDQIIVDPEILLLFSEEAHTLCNMEFRMVRLPFGSHMSFRLVCDC